MRRLLAGLVILACAATVAFAAGPKSRSKPPAPQMASSQDILRWINTYRANPEPHKLPAAVQAMSRLALFKESDQRAFMSVSQPECSVPIRPWRKSSSPGCFRSRPRTRSSSCGP